MTEPLKGAALRLNRFLGATLGRDAEDHAHVLLSAVIAEAKAEEREACAQIAESQRPDIDPDTYRDEYRCGQWRAANDAATLIRRWSTP